jgi:hypothetical protein
MQEFTYGRTTEMIVKAMRLDARVVEAGVPYRARGGGPKVSGTVKGTLLAGYRLIATTLRYALDAGRCRRGAGAGRNTRQSARVCRP